MKLEPIYLVAPEPEPPKVTRRAAILACASAALACGTIGFLVGTASRPSYQPTGAASDPEAEFARDLESLSLSELADALLQATIIIERREDLAPRVWLQVERLTAAVVSDQIAREAIDIPTTATHLVDLIAGRRDAPPALVRQLPALRRRSRN